MKNKLFQFFAMSLLVLGLGAMTSCKDDDGPEEGVIWDIYPTDIYVELVDEAGNNLLDPNVEGNWVGEDLYITYKGETYTAAWDIQEEHGSRMYLPEFYGLIWTGRYSWEQKPRLAFGEFSGEGNYDMSLTFGVPALDASYDFQFKQHFYWKHHEPMSDNCIIFDGKEMNGCTLKLVFPPNPNKE